MSNDDTKKTVVFSKSSTNATKSADANANAGKHPGVDQHKNGDVINLPQNLDQNPEQNHNDSHGNFTPGGPA